MNKFGWFDLLKRRIFLPNEIAERDRRVNSHSSKHNLFKVAEHSFQEPMPNSQ